MDTILAFLILLCGPNSMDKNLKIVTPYPKHFQPNLCSVSPKCDLQTEMSGNVLAIRCVKDSDISE